jgi:hypothetical protein
VPGLVLRQQVQAEKDEIQFGVQRQASGISNWSQSGVIRNKYLPTRVRPFPNVPDPALAICGGFEER